MTSPTQRALAECRKRGWPADVVERWIPGANVRRDLFGWADLVVLRPELREVVGVQVTSTGVAARVRKLLAAPLLPVWLACGGKAEVWGYRKLKRGCSRPRWSRRVVVVSEEDLVGRSVATQCDGDLIDPAG